MFRRLHTETMGTGTTRRKPEVGNRAVPLTPARLETATIRTPPPAPTSPEDRALAVEFSNPLRKIAVTLAIAYAFIQFTKLHEIAAELLGFNTYILNLVGLPALIFTFLCGGLIRTLRSSIAKLWVGFAFLLVLAVPFSTWVASSLTLVWNYLRTDFTLLFMLGGVILTWQEFRRLATVLALAAVVDVVVGRTFVKYSFDNRAYLTTGTMQDPNDFAALLLLVLPFVLYLVIGPGKNPVIRIAGLGIISIGLFSVLRTGSRGALIGLLAGIVFCLWRFSLVQKLVFVVVLIAGVGIYSAILPDQTVARFTGIFSGDASDDASVLSRTYLLQRSVEVTITHPVLGIGPGEFANFEGLRARESGFQGAWHDTHNSVTQVSSEVGIPAALLFLGAIVSSLLLINKSYNLSRRLPPSRAQQEIAALSFSLMLAGISFFTGVMFLSLAYRLYLPALSGMAIALWRLTSYEARLTQSPAAGNQVKTA